MVRSQATTALTIGRLAAMGGVGVETIRFYQRKGLLETPSSDGGIRRYDGATVRRLRFIRQAQAAGFSLLEIKELLALDASEDRARARELVRKRVAELEVKIAELQQARDALGSLANACSDERGGPCPILTSFDR